MVVHACNPSYLRSKDQEARLEWGAGGEDQQDLISTNKSGMVVLACKPSYMGAQAEK
jgi:hypothetical protein